MQSWKEVFWQDIRILHNNFGKLDSNFLCKHGQDVQHTAGYTYSAVSEQLAHVAASKGSTKWVYVGLVTSH